MQPERYDQIWHHPQKVRQCLDSLIEQFPELFPPGIEEGYQLRGHLPESKKLEGIRLRQIQFGGQVYTLRPSFVMSYMSGTVNELEHPLLLLSIGVPTWIITQIFGRDEMFWYRHLERLGRNRMVGTTVPCSQQIPVHVVADEHHGDWYGQKGYVAMTAGGGCILGMALSTQADENHLKEAYGVFAKECWEQDPAYTPQTVNTDGWWATQNAWLALFPTVKIILCFLHGFLSVRDRCRKATDLHTQIWEVFRAENVAEFYRKMKALGQWVIEKGSWSESVMDMVSKLQKRVEQYAVWYKHPQSHRTSNLVDRLMNRLTRYLYAGRGLHGHQPASELRLRGWALLQNFRPFAPRSSEKRDFQSPAHRLNQRQYHPHWLHNLQVCASCQGARAIT